MTAISAYPLIKTSAAGRDHSSVQAVEKINARAGFDGEYASRQQPQSWICTAAAKRTASQSGTDQVDPYWDAPRLTPAFVAQVMGQVYCTNAPLPSSAAAYRTPSPVQPAVLDKNI